MNNEKTRMDILQKRMQNIGIEEDDLIEKFILGSGSGGQKINKTSSCVYLKHLPSGLEVKCQQLRSREANRYLARLELCQRLEEMASREISEKKKQLSKVRRQNRKPSKAEKVKMSVIKKHRSSKKQLRKAPSEDF